MGLQLQLNWCLHYMEQLWFQLLNCISSCPAITKDRRHDCSRATWHPCLCLSWESVPYQSSFGKILLQSVWLDIPQRPWYKRWRYFGKPRQLHWDLRCHLSTCVFCHQFLWTPRVWAWYLHFLWICQSINEFHPENSVSWGTWPCSWRIRSLYLWRLGWYALRMAWCYRTHSRAIERCCHHQAPHMARKTICLYQSLWSALLKL